MTHAALPLPGIDTAAALALLHENGLAPRADAALPPRFVTLSADSRRIGGGSLFCALRGPQRDGRDFIDQAREKGAIAVLSEDESLSSPLPRLLVNDARRAHALLCQLSCAMPAQSLRLVGITGTNGKTTTAFLCEHLLRLTLGPCAITGTIHNGVHPDYQPAALTTPGPEELAPLLASCQARGARFAAMECSSHALDQQRVAGLSFAIAIFTNLTRDHFDYHGDAASYAAAKDLLFTQGLAPNGTAILNADDPHSTKLARQIKTSGRKVLTFGSTSDCDAHLTEDGPLIHGTLFDVPLLGEFNQANAAAALLAAHALGADLEALANALKSFPGVPGRMERFDKDRGGTAIVDFAHSPDGIEKALTALRPLCSGRLTIVFGCGGDRDRAKRPLMALAAARRADAIILTNDNPRSEHPEQIIADIRQGLPSDFPASVITDRERAVRTAWRDLRKGDILLVAGKGHEDTQITAGTSLPFSDRALLRRLQSWRQTPDFFNIQQLPEITGGTLLKREADDRRLLGAASDSREDLHGLAFFALKGEHFDGHAHLSQALAAGAALLVVHQMPDALTLAQAHQVLLVQDTTAAYQQIAAAWIERCSALVIGITGSSGKTSTKAILAELLELAAPGRTLSTLANTNNHIGVPQNSLRLRADDAYAVLEMGTNHPGEIAVLSRIARPRIAILTGIGASHIGHFESVDAIMHEKTDIFRHMHPEGTAVIPASWKQRLLSEGLLHGRAYITFGQEEDADCRLISCKNTLSGAIVSLRLPSGQDVSFTTSLSGTHQALNICACAAALHLIGLERQPELLRRLKHIALPGLRMKKQGRFLLDCYNANPQSCRALIDYLAEVLPDNAHPKAFLVLGDMLELGHLAPELHSQTRDYAIAKLQHCCQILTVGPLYAALPPTPLVSTCSDNLSASRLLQACLAERDLVILKGSRGLRLESIHAALTTG